MRPLSLYSPAHFTLLTNTSKDCQYRVLRDGKCTH
uniref:Uncharacterized protein n=1 Tax=Anguilla anguilla TaxID=7936 RepID=A0A0E9TBE6_ANGAN